MVTEPEPTSDDATLVAQVRAGNRAAFDLLLARHYPSVLRLCHRLLGATFEAQDIAQEAALQAFLNLERLHDPARFGAWLHAIAANLARMALRRRHMLPLGLESFAYTSAPSPEAVALAREVHDTIIAALNDLSLANRQAVVGFYLQGYSYAELAHLLGVPLSALKGRLFKGRQQLRQSLAPLARELLANNQTIAKEKPMTATAPLAVQIERVEASPEPGPHQMVVLRASDTRVLPIFIGGWEADAIRMALEGQAPPRPLTHDLTLRLLATLGAEVHQVVINRLAEKTFFAEVTLAQNGQQCVVDARPSDALALAARSSAPVLAAQAVLDEAGGPDTPAFWAGVAEKVRQYHQQVK